MKPIAFLTPLRTEVVRPGVARTIEPFVYYSDRLQRLEEVPAGFVFDWDSIPRHPSIFYAFLKGRAQKAYVIHDYLYAYPNGISRRTADLVMLDALREEMIEGKWRGAIVRGAIYAGVRLGGWAGWRRHRENEP